LILDRSSGATASRGPGLVLLIEDGVHGLSTLGDHRLELVVATILKESALVLAGFAPVGVFAALIYGLFLIAEAEISRAARYRECCCGPSLPGMLVQVRGAPAWITVSEISRVCVSFCVSWR